MPFHSDLRSVTQMCTFQLLLDLVVANIRFVWILPPLEVDPVRKDGVGVEVKVKVDGVVVIGRRRVCAGGLRLRSRRRRRGRCDGCDLPWLPWAVVAGVRDVAVVRGRGWRWGQ